MNLRLEIIQPKMIFSEKSLQPEFISDDIFMKSLHEYDVLQMKGFDEYYLHYTDLENKANKIDACFFERSELKGSREYHLHREYSLQDAPKYGGFNAHLLGLRLTEISHCYCNSSSIDKMLVGNIKTLDTMVGQKLNNTYKKGKELVLYPFIIKKSVFDGDKHESEDKYRIMTINVFEKSKLNK